MYFCSPCSYLIQLEGSNVNAVGEELQSTLFIEQPGTANRDTDTSLLLVNQAPIMLLIHAVIQKFHFALCSHDCSHKMIMIKQ